MPQQRAARFLLLVCLLLSACTLAACAQPAGPVDPSQFDLISTGMSEAEVIERLGPPGLIAEQPRTPVQAPTASGIEFREKRRYTYYYPGTLQRRDLLIIFEDGVVVDKGPGAH